METDHKEGFWHGLEDSGWPREFKKAIDDLLVKGSEIEHPIPSSDQAEAFAEDGVKAVEVSDLCLPDGDHTP